MKGALLLHALFSLCLTVSVASASAEDEFSEEIADLKHRIIELQNKGSLGVGQVKLCSQIKGLGRYTALPDNKVKADKFYVYYEPLNPYTKIEGGEYKIHLVQDLYILDMDGNVLFGKEKAFEAKYETHSPVLDLYVSNTITLTGAPAGRYLWKAVLHDKIRGDSTTVKKEFVIE